MRSIWASYLKESSILSEEDFFEKMLASMYLSERSYNKSFKSKILLFQNQMMNMVELISSGLNISKPKVLKSLDERTATINREGRITGDSVCRMADRVMRLRKQVSSDKLYEIIMELTWAHILNPDYRGKKPTEDISEEKIKRFIKSSLTLVKDYQEGV